MTTFTFGGQLAKSLSLTICWVTKDDGDGVGDDDEDDDAFRYLHLELTLCDPLQVSARWAIVSIQWAPHRPAETQSTTSRWCC